MQTWHIHIGGLVQGVGFRPYINLLAEKMKLNGWVSNGNDGVHIEINATGHKAQQFYKKIVSSPPVNAIISSSSIKETTAAFYSSFTIKESSKDKAPDLLLTPDIAICPQCKKELFNPKNKRYRYPFTTCLNCGPRYSIITSLPYDRENTTMNELPMCDSCSAEYHDIHDRRHYSQTNSCNDCEIPMHLYNTAGEEICNDKECILVMVDKALKDGHIVAVKGIGGYLLLCDATNAITIETLRDRKQRPAKAFALLYPSIEMAEKDVWLNEKEKEALESKAAPIVLCQHKKQKGTGIHHELIAPGLNKLGIMLPYTPLLLLIAQQFNKPLIATSGNLSGSPIIYSDDEALCWLFDYADFLLSFDRDIVMPQDDSVIQFCPESKQKIILRRSRGWAPNYFPNSLRADEVVLATGGELKSAFAILQQRKLFVSQFLGDQESFESQITYKNTLQHLLQLLNITPQQILVDKHPNYHVSQYGKELAAILDIPVIEIQHHQAHFAAVLGENNLLYADEPVLGVIWDGTGYGDDGQIWGGEFFIYEDQQIERVAWLDYFPQLMGDKMSKEPRLSAVSLLRNNMEHLMTIRSHFTVPEREYLLKLVRQQNNILTSGIGRLLDGIASILNIQHYNTYEGEAAMKLETLACTSEDKSLDYYPVPLVKNRLDWSRMMEEIIHDKEKELSTSRIAWKVFVSLAKAIQQIAFCFDTKKIAFSGGVFQNALLVDLVQQLMSKDYELYFHQQLSPNDECISYGQIAYYYAIQASASEYNSANKMIIQN